MAIVNIEVQAQVISAIRGMASVSSAFTDIKKANQDAAGALGVFGVSLTALNNPLTAVAGLVKDSIDTTLQWADGMDKMARNTGMTTEAASKMAVIFGDFGISAGQTTMAIKTLNKEGLSLNIETLKRLSAEYQAIKNPVDQLAFATKHFGRAAQDMTEILSKTPEEFDQLSMAAEKSGKIMSGEAVEAAQKLKLQLAQLGDEADGLKISLGSPLIGGLLTAKTSFDQLGQSIELAQIAMKANTGVISWESAALQTQVIVQGRTNAAMQEGNENRFTAIAALQRQVPAIEAATNAYSYMIGVEEALTAAQIGVNEAHQKGTEVYGLAEAAMAKMNIGEQKRIEIETQLKLLSGELTQEDVAREKAVGFLTKQYELGRITQEQYLAMLHNLATGADTAASAIKKVGDMIMGLPDSKDINIRAYTSYGAEPGPAASIPAPAPGSDSGNYGNQYSRGGDFIVPPGFENDSYRMRVQTGERVIVIPAGGGGNTTNNYNLNVNNASGALNVPMAYGTQKAVAGSY